MQLTTPFVSRLKEIGSNQVNNAVGYLSDEAKKGLMKNLLPIGIGLGTLGGVSVIGGGMAGYNVGKNKGYEEVINSYGIPMNNFSYMNSCVEFGYKTPNLTRIKNAVDSKLSKLAKSGNMVSSESSVRKKATERYEKLKSIPSKLANRTGKSYKK